MGRKPKYETIDGLKTCSSLTCKQTNPQPIHKFFKRKNSENYRSQCNECVYTYRKQYREDPAVKAKTQAHWRAYYFKYRTSELMEKRKAYAREFREQNKDFLKAKRLANKQRVENARLIKEYGIDKNEKNKKFAEQNEQCAICKQKFKIDALYVDHCHKTGRLRDLLCSLCNSAEGFIKSDIERAQALVDYLRKWKP